MDTLVHIGLIVYLAYIPVFALMVAFAIRRYKGYSFTSYWVSNLGDTRFPSSRIFNLAITLYGILTLFFISNLAVVVPHILLSQLAIVLMCVASFAVIMEAVIPFNKDIVVHHLFTEVICFATVGFLLLLWYPLSLVRGLSPVIFILSASIILEFIIFAISYIPIEIKLGKVPYTFIEVRNQETSFLSKNAALFEWLFVVLSVCWNVLVALTLLRLTPLSG